MKTSTTLAILGAAGVAAYFLWPKDPGTVLGDPVGPPPPPEPPAGLDPTVPFIPAEPAEGPVMIPAQRSGDWPEPAIIRPLIDLTTTGEMYGGECDTDGGKVDKGQWGKPSKVAHALQLLGYGVDVPLDQPHYVSEIKRFQRRARALSLTGTVGEGIFHIDGVMGLCTLRALTDAAILYNQNQWSD
jgi:hypothetical protein